MDPLAALIGAGGSVIGSMMNTSSTQAINAANLQQQLFMAQGGYLPGLVSNAQKAGINPLAVLGIHAPTGGTMVAPNPGAGVAAAAASLASMKDPHQRRMEELQERAGETDIQLRNAQVTNTMVESARNRYVLNQLVSGKYLPGDTRPNVGGFGELGAGWISDLVRSMNEKYPSTLGRLDSWVFGK